jgi:hypothetical protein
MKKEKIVPKLHIKFRHRELPRRKHITFRTRRKFEIKNDKMCAAAPTIWALQDRFFDLLPVAL